MNTCGRCGKPVAANAARCPHCGVRLMGTRSATAAEQAAFDERVRALQRELRQLEQRRKAPQSQTKTKLDRINDLSYRINRMHSWPGFIQSLAVRLILKRLAGMFLRESDESVRGVALSAITGSAVSHPDLATSVLKPMLEQITAILATTSFGPELRASAANGLGHVNDIRSLRALLDALGDENSKVRLQTASALGRIGNEQSVEPLIDALQDSNKTVRNYVAQALGEIGDERALEPLLNLLQSEDADDRRAAAEGLAKLGDQRAVDPLIAALKRKDEVFWVTVALGEIGDSRAVEPLVAFLNSPQRSSTERRGAATALGKIGDRSAVPALIAILKDDDAGLRTNAINALGELGDPSAFQPLIQALQNEEKADNRRSAAWALGKLGIPEAREPLRQALQDDNTRVREVAAKALERLG